MARKNPDNAKAAYKRLAREILKHGAEGKDELRQIFETHEPGVIFRMPSGPEREARAAQLVSEMTIAISNLTGEPTPKKVVKKKSSKKAKERAAEEASSREYPGKFEGFRYVIVHRPDGRFTARITKQARQIILPDAAPRIIDHPLLDKRFDRMNDAELAVRRIINTSLIWHAERGIVPMERSRRSQAAMQGLGMKRRTPGQTAAIQRKLEAAREAEGAVASRIKTEEQAISAASKRGSRQRKPRQSARGEYVPKKNPDVPKSEERMKQIEAGVSAGSKSFMRYKDLRAKMTESLGDDEPDFLLAMKAYDNISDAVAFFSFADRNDMADKLKKIRRDYRENIVDMLKFCTRELKKATGDKPKVKQATKRTAKKATKGRGRRDLSHQDLSGKDLRGQDLRNANLREANLRNANLHHVDLSKATLVEVDLRGANLGASSLREAHLWGAELDGANLRGADLREADLSSADLRNADLRGARMLGAKLHHADLHGAKLQGADLRGVDLSNVDLSGAILDDQQKATGLGVHTKAKKG